MNQPLTWLQAPEPAEQIALVQRVFHEKFGYHSDGVWGAPGRVNLIGEHIDYCGGTVMPLALPHRTLVAASPRSDTVLRAYSLQTEELVEVDLTSVAPGTVQGWITYVAGVPWAMAEEKCGLLVGADLVIDSAVPVGGGLSSSAALECSTALVFDAFSSYKSPERALCAATDSGRAQLAKACIRAENEIAGANTGGMDQSISLRAAEGSVLAIDCRDFSTKTVDVDVASAGLDLLVIDTKAPHQLADGQYAQRRRVCEYVAELMQVKLLRDFLSEQPSVEEVDAALERIAHALRQADLPTDITLDSAFEMSRHVLSEVQRVSETSTLFSVPATAESFERLGQLLSASHASLRDDFKVSVRELDTACDEALAAGALGARMVGGGFGGSALALVEREKVASVASAIANAFERQGFNPPVFLTAVPSYAARQEA